MDFLAVWQFVPALFACKAPYHLDRVRKNADPLFKRAPIDFIEILKKREISILGKPTWEGLW